MAAWPPSPWIQRWSHLVPEQGIVLDLACGRGRHVRWFAGRGHAVVGVDNAPDALRSLDDLVQGGQVRTVLADLENGPWPLSFAAVVVTNYLWRPLLPHAGEPGARRCVDLRNLCPLAMKPWAGPRARTSCCNPASCWPPVPGSAHRGLRRRLSATARTLCATHCRRCVAASWLCRASSLPALL
jgi:SAM-dependent methyltransferase